MAKGNVYLVIAKPRFDDPIPNKVKAVYSWEENIKDEFGELVLDGEGNPTKEVMHPTWKQVARKYKRQFGPAIEVDYAGDGKAYKIIEMDLSFLTGEIDELISLKGAKRFPKYRLLTRKEARRFVRGNLNETAETAGK